MGKCLSVFAKPSSIMTKRTYFLLSFQVGGVTGMYCFYPAECHPLRLAVFSYLPLDAHKVNIILYTK